jgi:hypothetical protein
MCHSALQQLLVEIKLANPPAAQQLWHGYNNHTTPNNLNNQNVK